MNLPSKAVFLALVCELLLSPCLFVWQHALPLTHMLGFVLVWDREPVFEFSIGGYTVMVIANLAVLFTFWLLFLLLFRRTITWWSRGGRAVAPP